MPVSTGNIAISTCVSLQGTQSAASRFTLHRHPSCGNGAPNVADMRLNAAHESTELMSLTKHPQKHATCQCGLIRLQDKTKKGIPLKPGCLPMYLYNLSPAEDGILASRPEHGIGYTHSPARLSTCDSATPSYLPQRGRLDELLPAMPPGRSNRVPEWHQATALDPGLRTRSCG